MPIGIKHEPLFQISCEKYLPCPSLPSFSSSPSPLQILASQVAVGRRERPEGECDGDRASDAPFGEIDGRCTWPLARPSAHREPLPRHRWRRGRSVGRSALARSHVKKTISCVGRAGLSERERSRSVNAAREILRDSLCGTCAHTDTE